MTFKEAIQDDIKGVFLNFEEFGEYHELNGQKTLIVIDENELTEREKREKKVNGVDGELHNRQFLFYVAAEDFGPLPAPGRRICSGRWERMPWRAPWWPPPKRRPVTSGRGEVWFRAFLV